MCQNVLSCTLEQVKFLIKDAENGLLSRFLFYCINSTPEWLDGFDGYGKDGSIEEFDQLGQRFEAEKDRMQELNGDLYSASSHRLAWGFLRIAMVLTTLRMMDTGRFADTEECADEDFETTIGIISTLSHHNDYIFNVLNKERPEGIATADSYSAATRTVILDSLPGQFTTDDMKAIAVKVGKTLRTVQRQIKRAIESGEIQIIRAGEYRKL